MKTIPFVAACLAIAAVASAAQGAQFGVNNGGGKHDDAVSRAEFFRLQGQVQELERRVSALEQGGGRRGGKASKGAGK
jgi:hypothetical protein